MSAIDLAARPLPGEYNLHYTSYVQIVPDGDIRATLESSGRDASAFYSNLTEAQANHRYAPGKWTIKQVLGHVTETERIFAYRALRFARNDSTPLAGYEDEHYVRHARFETWPLDELIEQFTVVRRASVILFRHLDNGAWSRHGVANHFEITVRALAWIIAGHEIHHRQIVAAKYL
jgi:hypothetical protein